MRQHRPSPARAVSHTFTTYSALCRGASVHRGGIAVLLLAAYVFPRDLLISCVSIASTLWAHTDGGRVVQRRCDFASDERRCGLGNG